MDTKAPSLVDKFSPKVRRQIHPHIRYQLFKLVHPKTEPNAAASESSSEAEIPITGANGRKGRFMLRWRLIQSHFDKDHTATRLIGTILNIDQRQRAVRNRQASTPSIHAELQDLWNRSLAAIKAWEKSVADFAPA